MNLQYNFRIKHPIREEQENIVMKKLIAIALTAVMLLGLLAGCGNSGSDDSGLKTVESGKLIMSTNAAFPPYEMTTDDGGFAGIDVEIAQAIADKLGLELEIDDMDFDAALLAVQQGKSDIVMAGVSVTEKRLLVMDFSDSYATGVQVVIVKEGSDVTMDNLGEKMIGTQRGTTGYLYASDTPENGGYGEDHVTAYENGMTAVQALINGQVDCVIIDKAPALEYVASNPGLTILEGNWVEEQYAIGFGKGNTALKDAVNQALAELIADGTVQGIIDKYITAE
jgi:polar amino acid transport system substrate-binding protein